MLEVKLMGWPNTINGRTAQLEALAADGYMLQVVDRNPAGPEAIYYRETVELAPETDEPLPGDDSKAGQ